MRTNSSLSLPFKGRFGGVFLALLCLPLCLMAGKKSEYRKDPKYLLGAVPEVEGIVTFQKSFNVTDKSEPTSTTHSSATPYTTSRCPIHASSPTRKGADLLWLALRSI